MAGTAGLRGCTVVVTRPEDQADALAEPLRLRGATVRVRPLVRIAPPADGGAALAAALRRLAGYDWVVFTSSQAVHACARRLGRDASWPLVGCVGEATARVAREYGLQVAAMPQQFTGAALPEAMQAAAAVAGRRVLWPRASGAAAALLEGLTAAGATVDAVEAYQTVEDASAARALRAELVSAPADVVSFTSPSGVRVFMAGGGGYGGAVAVIGTVTGRAARAAGLDVQVQPETHTVESLVEAIELWWRARA